MTKLVGKTINQLTVVSHSDRIGKNGQKYLWCRCSCSKEIEVRLDNFSRAAIKSCGCARASARKKEDYNFSISSRPAEVLKISEERGRQGAIRRRIEDLTSKYTLKNELDDFAHCADIG